MARDLVSRGANRVLQQLFGHRWHDSNSVPDSPVLAAEVRVTAFRMLWLWLPVTSPYMLCTFRATSVSVEPKCRHGASSAPGDACVVISGRKPDLFSNWRASANPYSRL
jgi:hypothetical protein